MLNYKNIRNIIIGVSSIIIIMLIAIIIMFIVYFNNNKKIEDGVKETITQKADDYLAEKYGKFDYSIDDFEKSKSEKYDFKCRMTMLTDIEGEECTFSVNAYAKDGNIDFEDTYISLLINHEAEKYIKKIVDEYYSDSIVYGKLSGFYYSNDIKDVSQYNEIEYENNFMKFGIYVDATGQTYDEFIEIMNKMEGELTEKIKDGKHTFSFIINGMTSYGIEQAKRNVTTENDYNGAVMKYEFEFE